MNNKINKIDKKNEKVKHKFNIVDFFIIILVATIIITSIYAIMSWSDIKTLWSTSTKELQYVVELRGVDNKFINNIKKNDLVIDAVSKSQLGTVQSADSIEPYYVLDYEVKLSEDGTPNYNGVLAENKTKYNITVYISATAQYEKGVGYTVNGKRIAVGEVLELRFPNFTSTAYCVSISGS